MGIQVSYKVQDLLKACHSKHGIKIESEIHSHMQGPFDNDGYGIEVPYTQYYLWVGENFMGQTEDLNENAWFDNKNILHESRELLDSLGVEYSRC